MTVAYRKTQTFYKRLPRRLLCVLAFAALSVAAAADVPPEIRAEQRELLSSLGFNSPSRRIEAIDFTAPLLSGGSTSLEEHRPNLVILNFWATWCPPCRIEKPALEQLHREFQGAGLKILSVNMQENPLQVRQYVHETGTTFPVLMDSSGRISATYGIRSIPTSYLISSEGTVLAVVQGALDWSAPRVIQTFRRIVALEEKYGR
ncbi:Thiol-disulfide isomerase or thioredoxin [Alkalispirochaeta americana]|uniref:Thiol-disulfide isomerase or thioredoxin n=1 Tax=Alkalispirochaeta americana TaxID=159291 RepID=A0A1N6WQL3_9SPIO|nr:TlpA disulfide reductase family protein [Alkalispirochaeta americana]SIQ92296.1 Thiol-disulfide isomerase or thioredoxin [Alkalispirochaeta americana]